MQGLRGFVLGLTLGLSTGMAAAQSSETLADLQAQLATLNSSIQSLRSELDATGAQGTVITGNTLDRLSLIEGELQRLTGATEQLAFRIDRIVRDGTTQIDNLRFQVCELQPECDISKLGPAQTLGGGPAQPTLTSPPASSGPELAVGEAADLQTAQNALEAGDFAQAASLFAQFRATFPGSPMEPQAFLGEGKALSGAGNTRDAARAFLNVYSGHPTSAVAPEALMRLGVALGELGKTPEACVTLAEVSNRYPGTPAVSDAAAALSRFGCS